MKIRALKGRVLLRRTKPDWQQSKGGVWLPDSARDLPSLTEIVGVSDGSDLSVGDLAISPNYEDTRRFETDNGTIEIQDERDVYATVSLRETKGDK